MGRFFFVLVLAALSVQLAAAEPDLETLLGEFKTYSGAELVFTRDDLPQGRYHDVLKPLTTDESKKAAAAVCIEEARMYPPGFLGEVGLKAVGLFAVCVSKKNSESWRIFDDELGGYRYYGVYNRKDAIASAFYNEGQLAMTFHHELFHHVDSTVDGETDSWQLSGDDAFYQGAISGLRPYAAPQIAGEYLRELRKRRTGITLKDAVSEYAAKNSREDQAETARHMMSMLPSSLVQVIDQPELAGSQRIMHILREYEQSVPDGPDFDWFVDVALGRARRDVDVESVDHLIVRLNKFADGGSSGYAGVDQDPAAARSVLRAVVRVKPVAATPAQADELVRLATDITSALLRQRIKPDQARRRFEVWGHEEAGGVNRTLRHDVTRFASDAKRLALISTIHHRPTSSPNRSLALQQAKNLRLVARYYAFIKSSWSMTPGTQEVFESARRTFLESVPDGNAKFVRSLRSKDLLDLAR